MSTVNESRPVGASSTAGPLYYPPNARYDEQRERMNRLEEAGDCCFCNLNDVLIETQDWRVKPNAFPYKGTKTHLLIIPRRHVTDMAQLIVPDEWASFGEVLAATRAMFGYESIDTGLGLVLRSGNPAETAGTICHIHWHFIRGDHDDPDRQAVRVKVSAGIERVGD